MRGFVRRQLERLIAASPEFQRLRAENRFLLSEIRRINEERRLEALGQLPERENLAAQTRESFDYQWSDFHEGVAMPSDTAWMQDIAARVCQLSGLPREWFAGKHVADIGCGAGRWSYGMLSMGAHVTACDQSESALKRTRELAGAMANRLETRQVNLLEWTESAAFDLVFCFGVVHHTGNTYLAIRNTAAKVAPGGRLFLMIYGFPETTEALNEQNAYADLRREWRLLSLPERRRAAIERFGPELGHGWFDAVSPQVNDLLTFDEIADLLGKLGFENVRRTDDNRSNHHLVADRRREP
jgi:2-polyprenyl-3-methyl-5-hydroxy-6-metoxy-1,4-benzoquinol methylase